MTFEELKRKCAEKAVEHPKGEKVRKHISHPEDALQIDCVSWFRDAYPELAPLLFHPNNEAFFGKGKTPAQQARAGKRAKDMGIVPGVADLILLFPASGKHGLCIEMKSKEGRQRDTQKDWQKVVEANGYDYRICKTRDDFRNMISLYTGITPVDPDIIAARRLFGDKVRVRK